MKKNVTRGYGVLEGFLAKKRAAVANSLMSEGLIRGGRLLDLGCGTYPYFLSIADEMEKYGLDKNLNENCKEQFKDIKLQKFDIENENNIPFQDSYFNVVTMLAVCEHLSRESLSHKLQEIYRILKPGGAVIMTTPALWTAFILNTMAKLRLISSEEIKDHKRLYSLSEISILLNQAGFSLEAIKAGYFELFMNTWVIAKK